MNSAKDIAGNLTWTRALEHEVNQVQLIRERRFSGEQDLAFGARPFILCGMPIRRLPKGIFSYRRRNGKFFLEIVGHPEWGVPFGQDRLVLLYLATNAIRSKSATVWFRSGAEILLEWGMPTNGIYYERLMLAFQRVFGSTMFFGSSEEQRETKVWECSRVHFFDSMKLWGRSRDGKTGPLRDNSITLSPEFWKELQEHPIPVDAEVVRMLASNPGCLDLYTWLTWRCHQAKRLERIPLFGSFGLASQLGVQTYTRERKFRERIRGWLNLVRLYWPECPATVSTNGSFLEVNHASAIMPQQQSLLAQEAR